MDRRCGWILQFALRTLRARGVKARRCGLIERSGFEEAEVAVGGKRLEAAGVVVVKQRKMEVGVVHSHMTLFFYLHIRRLFSLKGD